MNFTEMQQEINALKEKIRVLESNVYQRDRDVLIGLPTAIARQLNRTQRFILVTPSTGQQWNVEVDSLGSFVLSPL